MTTKVRKDIEALVAWALREEIPKGSPVSLSAWDAISNFATLGTRVDVSRGGGGDGLGFVPGTPHPDAERIALAVRALDKGKRIGEAGCAKLIGGFAECDALAVRAVAQSPFNLAALVIRCAVLGVRMEWDVGTPQLRPVTYSGQRHAIVFGVDDDGQLMEVKADRRGRYNAARSPRCHVAWDEPSIGFLLEARAEYAAWHHALTELADVLRGTLDDFEVTGPEARAEPWRTGQVEAPRVLDGGITVGAEPLPLKPARPVYPAPVESPIEREAREQARGAAARKAGKKESSPHAPAISLPAWSGGQWTGGRA